MVLTLIAVADAAKSAVHETVHGAVADAAAHEASGGLPQLNVLFDGSFTNQLVWLGLTFVFLYIVLSQIVLPRLGTVLTEREEAIAADHDRARAAHAEAEKIKAAYEDSLTKARTDAQSAVADAREKAAADLSAAQAKLDAKLAASAADAEKRIDAAVAEAMGEMGAVAGDIAGDLYQKLTGEDADAAAVKKAVGVHLTPGKGA